MTPPAQQLVYRLDDDLRLERFDKDRVVTDLPRPIFVNQFERPGQKHDGNVRQRGILLNEGCDLVAITLRHAGIGQHDIRQIRGDSIERLLSILDRDHPDILVGERQLDRVKPKVS